MTLTIKMCKLIKPLTLRHSNISCARAANIALIVLEQIHCFILNAAYVARYIRITQDTIRNRVRHGFFPDSHMAYSSCLLFMTSKILKECSSY